MHRIAVSILVLQTFIAGAAQSVTVTPAFPGLAAFASPLAVADPLDGTDRLFVVERAGRIYSFDNDAFVAQRTLFLDISDSVTTQTEGGLLGIAFHPDYVNNGYFFVTYTSESPRRTILARFTTSANPDVADPQSELRLLSIGQTFLHHKGGCLQFGPEGYLYMSLGDDGQSVNSQDLTRLEGKLLRIDVDNPGSGMEYGIPPSNPFAGNMNGYREEIYAFGFRNPWRFSFEPSGRLWLGDVGEQSYEEIDIVHRGRNYGWPRMEASTCYQPPGCDTAGLNIHLPIHEYPHGGSASVTGGYVYRGSAVPSLFGKYVFSDYVTGAMWSLAYDGVNPPAVEPISGPGSVTGFGIDGDGEVYVASFDGIIYRFVESTTAVGSPAPVAAHLSVRPNPFPSNTTVEYSVSIEARVTLDVFDVRGRRVTTLVDRHDAAGDHVAAWDGRDAAGRSVPSGVYFCRLWVDGAARAERRIILLK
jgi:glucose/arabinose dehydrogenase